MFNKDRGENIKTWLEILSTAIVGCLFLTLLIFPGRLKWWCNRGNFDECNVFGQKLTQAQKENLQTQERVTAEALTEINRVLETKDILSKNQVETFKKSS